MRVNGLDISVLAQQGRGRPVVFLHGNSSTKQVWRQQLDAVAARGRPVLAPDFPGHGESGDAALPAATYSFPGYAAVVSGLLDKLDWTNVDVIGWSLGGHVGLELLATEPRVASLLIVGTPPVRLRPESLHEAFFVDDDMTLAGKRDFSEADVKCYGAAMMGGREHVTPAQTQAIRRTDGNARYWMFRNALGGVGADQRLAAETTEKRLCIVHGEREPFVRLSYLQALNCGKLWRQRVHIIPQAGHAPHWETPAAFNQILLDFLGISDASQMGSGRTAYRVA